MARQSATAVHKDFSGGLITEASGLNFPENACTAMVNCTPTLIGSIQRRLGINYEVGFQNNPIIRGTGDVITGFLWRNVNNDGNTYIYVQQVGSKLYFYDVSTDGSAVSPNLFTQFFDLTLFSPSGAPIPNSAECQFAAGNGYLFVVHPYLEPFSVSYTSSVFTTHQTTIQIRDFEGIFENTATTFRPTTLTNIHKYNLFNQGWFGNTTGGEVGHTPATDYITAFFSGPVTAPPAYPSNADVWWNYINNVGVLIWSAGQDALISRGTFPAPKGFYIGNAFNFDRNALSGLTGLTVTSSDVNRPSTVAFHSGRVFYSGVNSSGYGANIYFTQILDIIANAYTEFGICYQMEDPTNKDLFDLLPSDGGVIKIADCGTVLKLFSIQGALIVFATNGIWTVTGSSGLGFTATDYTVNKLSSIRCISGTSFVDVLGFPFFWCNEGIYTIRVDISAGGLRVYSLTDNTIKTFYNNIPLTSKRLARGAYNPQTFTIQWLYNSQAQTQTDKQYSFDSILNFNTILGCFYPWSITTTSTTLPVLNGATVIDIPAKTSSTLIYPTKFIVSVENQSVTFAEARDTTYYDWVFVDNPASFTSGYMVHGQGIRKFQSNYAVFYMLNTQASQISIQGIWDFSTNTAPYWGSITALQNIYTTGTTNTVDIRKLKFPGRGPVFQYQVTSAPGIGFEMQGWSSYETVGGSV